MHLDAVAKCFNNFGSCKVLYTGDGSHGMSEFMLREPRSQIHDPESPVSTYLIAVEAN